jgi:hypothetical protein
MRIVLALILALFAAPTLAQERYDNARFGYGIDIPAAYAGQGESANGDGQAFRKSGTAELLVWGGYLTGAFEDEAGMAMRAAEADAWNITGQATTPRWAEFSAIKGIRILYQRLVLLCDAASYAAFRLDYLASDSAQMEADINRLTRSLRGDGC